jgi:hypothetical protein
LGCVGDGGNNFIFGIDKRDDELVIFDKAGPGTIAGLFIVPVR